MREGRYHEAERAQRGTIPTLKGGLELAHAYEILGDALLEQGRYPEAMRCYEAALDAHPRFRRSYRGVAEALLRQGGHADQALEAIERIAENPSDDYWSLRAWALAELGRSPEVTPAIGNALRATSRKSCADLAATWRRVGMAMQALGNAAEAEEFFRRAAEIDPGGRWGTLAKEALRRDPIPITRRRAAAATLP